MRHSRAALWDTWRPVLSLIQAYLI
jgi:hypothetical protein